MRSIITICILVLIFSCSQKDTEPEILPDLPDGVQAISLLGDTLFTAQISDEAKGRYEKNLSEEEAKLESDPVNADALIWKGRWTAYMGKYREAIRIYTEGIEKHPDDARMYRHRGHRYISIREFSRAIEDFKHAVQLIEGTEDKIEPDGMPNARNIPVSTLHSNIWYHLGLAYYLQNDMENALTAYQNCRDVSNNPDNVISSSNWLYMILRRLGREEEARQVLEPINAEMDVIENMAYHRLLLFYKGELTIDDLTGGSFESSSNAAIGYGIGNRYYYNGKVDEAKRFFRQIVAGRGWASFGYIAAESDLSRIE